MAEREIKRRPISTTVTLEFSDSFEMTHGAPPERLSRSAWRGRGRVVYDNADHSARWFCGHKHYTAEEALRCLMRRLFEEER